MCRALSFSVAWRGSGKQVRTDSGKRVRRQESQIEFYYRQAPWQRLQKAPLREEALQHGDNLWGGGGVGEAQHDDPVAAFRRVAADVCKIHVSGEQRRSTPDCCGIDLLVGRIRKADIACELNLVAKPLQRRYRSAGQIGVDQKAHAPLRGGQRMEGFLLNELAHESERRADVLVGKVVLAADVLEAHSAGKTPDDDRDGNPRATNHRLAVTDGGINDDAFGGGHGASDNRELAQVVESRRRRRFQRSLRTLSICTSVWTCNGRQ